MLFAVGVFVYVLTITGIVLMAFMVWAITVVKVRCVLMLRAGLALILVEAIPIVILRAMRVNALRLMRIVMVGGQETIVTVAKLIQIRMRVIAVVVIYLAVSNRLV
jgi:hypothetical protein